MKRYVTCRVVDTVPLTVTDRERPAAICKLAKVARLSPRQQRQPELKIVKGVPIQSVLKSLIGCTYAHHPFPAGQFLNIAL